MPYKLEKVGGRYFVTDDKGKQYSKEPMSRKRALAQIKALYASEKASEMSLNRRVDAVREAVYNSLRIPGAEVDFYVGDIYETSLILQRQGKTYRIDYQLGTDGIALSDPAEVEISWVPVGKEIYKAPKKDGLPPS